MSDYQTGYLLGFVVVLVLIVAVYFIFRKRRGGQGSMKGEYDERQQLLRGSAYKACAFSYMLEMAILLFLEGMQVDLPLTRGALYAIFFLLPIGIFAVMCIRKDAYIGIRSNLKQFITIGGIIVIVEIFVTIRYCVAGEMIVNGKLTANCLAPGLAILFFVVLATLLIHERQLAAESGEDE